MAEVFLYRKWFKWGIFNLAIVALYGTLMRYKIAYDLPLLNQKFLLHAHSHFAFSGWLGHIFYSGIAMLLFPVISESRKKIYKGLILLNLISAFGMLLAFTVQGYKAISITFSTISIIVPVLFALCYLKDSKLLSKDAAFKPWIGGALFFNVLSIFGPLVLAYLMASKNYNNNMYRASVYYFLHFQYNGWFFFAAVALITTLLPKNFPNLKTYFTIFLLTVIPTYFLSIMWLKIPLWLYVITVIASIIEMGAWISLLVRVFPILHNNQHKGETSWVNILLYIATFAMTIKFLLQTLSVIPSLSNLVFGFRSIVIAYLHLILLGVYSIFVLGYAFRSGILQSTNFAKYASFIFVFGVFLNESALGIQGFAAFSYTPVPYINGVLLFAALTLLLGGILLTTSQLIAKGNKSEKL